MGTWEWDLATNAVQWSDNLERIHGLAPGAFDGDVRQLRAARFIQRIASGTDRFDERAPPEGVPHDVEYRIVGPEGGGALVRGKGEGLNLRTGDRCA